MVEDAAGVKSENPAVDFSGFPFLPLPMRTGELRPRISLQFLTFSSSHTLFPFPSCIVFYCFFRSSYIILTMSFWREACQQLRHAVPKSANRTAMTQSRRYLSHSAPRQTLRMADSSSVQLSTRRNIAAWRAQQSYTGSRPVRAFSVTARAQHGQLTPPKPGEE